MSIWRPCGGVAVEVLDVRRFLVEIEGIGGGGLHLEGDFVGLDARFQLGVLLQILGVEFVELVDQIELPALFRFGDVRVADVLDHLIDRGGLGVDAGALVNAGQKGRPPVLLAAGRQAAARVQGDEAGHVLIFGAQAVNDPRAEARFGNLREPVFIITVAISCAGMSVYMERMTAMSSTCSAEYWERPR